MKKILIGLVSGFTNGLLGSGGGSLLVPSLNSILKLDAHKAHASALAVIIFFTITSSFIYIKNGIYDINITYKVAIGSIIGGIIGAKLLNKFSSKKLNIIFGVFMILASFRMVFK